MFTTKLTSDSQPIVSLSRQDIWMHHTFPQFQLLGDTSPEALRLAPISPDLVRIWGPGIVFISLILVGSSVFSVPGPHLSRFPPLLW